MENKFEYELQKLKNKKSLFLGYYGGGNYGDELLMEILMNYNEKNEIKSKFYFFNRVKYSDFHNNFKYSDIIVGFLNLLKETIYNEYIIFGGGGIFSEDSNYKHILLMCYLYLLTIFFRKKIIFIGFGIYKGTPFLNLIRFIMSQISYKVYLRDTSSLNMFKKSEKIIFDNDISFLLKKNDFSNNYEEIYINKSGKDYKLSDINSDGKIVVFSLRKTKKGLEKKFEKDLFQYIKNNSNTKFIFWEIMEEESVNNYGSLVKLENVYILKNQNPLNVFYTMKKYSSNLLFLTPQFHGIITGYLNDIVFLPIYYSYKGYDILNTMNKTSINIKDIDINVITNYILKNNNIG